MPQGRPQFKVGFECVDLDAELVSCNLQCGVVSTDFTLGTTHRQAKYKLFVASMAIDVEIDLAVAEIRRSKFKESLKLDVFQSVVLQKIKDAKNYDSFDLDLPASDGCSEEMILDTLRTLYDDFLEKLKREQAEQKSLEEKKEKPGRSTRR